MSDNKSTAGEDYARRLSNLSGAKWKVLLDTQRPYRWNLRRLKLGKTLDVGCGIGRNLINLDKGSVGVDHNKHAIELLKSQGYEAFIADDFMKNKKYSRKSFDSLLLAHVLEHLTPDESTSLLKEYLPYISDRVVVICPQEKGYTTDETHVTFLDAKAIEDVLRGLGLKIVRSYSFPFPRLTGRVFPYNETVVVAQV